MNVKTGRGERQRPFRLLQAEGAKRCHTAVASAGRTGQREEMKSQQKGRIEIKRKEGRKEEGGEREGGRTKGEGARSLGHKVVPVLMTLDLEDLSP